jgi:hypothetical protein
MFYEPGHGRLPSPLGTIDTDQQRLVFFLLEDDLRQGQVYISDNLLETIRQLQLPDQFSASLLCL